MPIAAAPRLAGLALIEQMAADLVRFDALGSQDGAMRSLLSCERYRPSDIGFYFEAAWRVGQRRCATALGDVA